MGSCRVTTTASLSTVFHQLKFRVIVGEFKFGVVVWYFNVRGIWRVVYGWGSCKVI